MAKQVRYGCQIKNIGIVVVKEENSFANISEVSREVGRTSVFSADAVGKKEKKKPRRWSM